MESWQELLRKKSIASLEALAVKFGAEHFPDLERLAWPALILVLGLILVVRSMGRRSDLPPGR